MEESQKMVALKKAYAEIILNTAKEAANRVMASEKKAIRYQHDLFSTKDEALRLLVRLKQMIDAKIIEAEIASSSQQTKIDELEAQLQEAEGVIIDLRAELQWVRDKLQKLRDNQVQPLNGKITRGDGFFYQNGTSEPYVLPPNLELQPLTTSDMKNTLFDQRILDVNYCNMEQNEQSSVSQLESHSSQNAELASIIMGNEEPELCRNGCTQRIHVLEGNLLSEKLPSSVEVDEHSLTKSQLIIRGSNKDDGQCTVPPPKTKNLEPVKNFSGEEVRKRVKARTLRRRRSRFGKTKAKRRSCPSQLKKTYQPPSILSRCKRYLVNGNAKPDERSCTLPSSKANDMDMEKHSSEFKEKLDCKNSSFMDENEEKRHRKVQSRDVMPTSFTSYPDEHKIHGNAKSGEDQSRMIENEVKLKPLPRLDPGLTLIKGGVDPISGYKNVTVSLKALNKSGIVQNFANKDMKLADELVKQGCEAATNSSFPCYETNPELLNMPLVYSDLESKEAMVDIPLMYSDLKDAKASKEPKGLPSQTDNGRILKYTFQRKRKKDALSSPDQNTSLEKSTVKRRAMEKPCKNDSPEPQKSSVINESSRDSRRLAQVAHQLVSLSGKRWW